VARAKAYQKQARLRDIQLMHSNKKPHGAENFAPVLRANDQGRIDELTVCRRHNRCDAGRVRLHAMAEKQ
jgi:hypothetical protein